MNPAHVNLTAYGDVESLDRFTQESFRAYCDTKLRECDPEVALLLKHCVNERWQARVCEIGSGSSKLLYRLEKEGLLREGVGVEVSLSRHKFAEAFKTYAGSRHVQNIHGSFLDLQPLAGFDAVIAVDIVFQLIAPLFATAESATLNWIWRSLRPGGYLLLELRELKEIAALFSASGQSEIRLWDRFPSPDPFEFCLSTISLGPAGLVVWKKTFLRRGSSERSQFEHVLKPYAPAEMIAALQKAGFSSTVLLPGWAPETYVLLAERPHA